MNRKQLEQFKQQLLKLKQRHQGDAQSLANEAFHQEDGKSEDNLSNIPVDDRAERGSDNFSTETTIALLEKANLELSEIDTALSRIEEKTFGRCDRCGQEIPDERLKVLPFARQCVTCATFSQRNDPVSPGNL